MDIRIFRYRYQEAVAEIRLGVVGNLAVLQGNDIGRGFLFIGFYCACGSNGIRTSLRENRVRGIGSGIKEQDAKNQETKQEKQRSFHRGSFHINGLDGLERRIPVRDGYRKQKRATAIYGRWILLLIRIGILVLYTWSLWQFGIWVEKTAKQAAAFCEEEGKVWQAGWRQAWNMNQEGEEEETNLENLLLMEQRIATGENMTEEELLFPEDKEQEEDDNKDLWEADADIQAEIQEEYLLAEQTESTIDTEPGGWTLPYSMEQLRDMDFLKTYIYNINSSTTADTSLLNADAMLEAEMSLTGELSDGPKILIHHTHATEYYADSDPDDPSTLIVGVGDYLEEILETKYGISVIHDKTVYSYNEAYSQALTHEEALLALYPTIEVMIDLHRDSAGTGKYTTEINGKSMANLMFFNGLSRNTKGEISYLPNANLADNLAFSFQLKMVGDSLYPGLCKRNYLKSYRYNLHILPKAVIVEVGDNNNTLEEAKNAMEPLAEILYTVLMGNEE
jgi:stage II sporulation protein P